MWLKSTETKGSSTYLKTSGMFVAAFLTISLISWAVASFLAMKFRSTIDTFGVGTRMAPPSNLPFNSGRTRPMALAAPVEVGIIDMAQARARRRSLWALSTIFWSLV